MIRQFSLNFTFPPGCLLTRTNKVMGKSKFQSKISYPFATVAQCAPVLYYRIHPLKHTTVCCRQEECEQQGFVDEYRLSQNAFRPCCYFQPVVRNRPQLDSRHRLEGEVLSPVVYNVYTVNE